MKKKGLLLIMILGCSCILYAQHLEDALNKERFNLEELHGKTYIIPFELTPYNNIKV